MTIKLFDIKRFAIHDGQGIRTTVFMQGCPLQCVWCHNPEGINCNISKENKGHFYTNSGEYDVQKVVYELLRDKPFFTQSRGGVTFSGGEPMMQADALLETLKILKKDGINTCVDTSGHCNSEDLLKIAEFTDEFLFDIKHTDDSEHLKHTGVSNKLILKNLKLLHNYRASISLRFPLIPDINDDKANISKIADIAKEFSSIKKIYVLPFHKLARSKYSRHKNLTFTAFEEPTTEQIQSICKFFINNNIITEKGG